MKKEHPGAKNMIPLGQPGNEEYDRSVRAKIKGSASAKRKLSQKILGIKKMKNPSEQEKRVLELITNPEVSAMQIQNLLEIAIKKDLTESNFLKLIDIVINKHKALFGTKMEVQSKVTNLDLMLERIKDYKEATINGSSSN